MEVAARASAVRGPLPAKLYYALRFTHWIVTNTDGCST